MAVRLLADAPWEHSYFSAGWCRAELSHQTTEPASGAGLSTVGVAGAADIARAAAEARAIQPSWAATLFEERAAIFREAAQLARENAPDIVNWIVRETGSIEPKAQFELGVTIRCLYEAAAMPSQPQGLVLPSSDGRMSFCRRVPLGVIGVISPFNFPLYLSARAVAPALAIGNAVVLKPDLRTPVAGGFILARLFEAAGLPSGILRVLPGGAEAGESLCIDPNVAMIQFTGSTSTGRRVGELAGRTLKKVSLELGGKNSLIVLDDADLDAAVSNAAWSSFLHQGQICMASGRVLVQKAIVSDFAARIAAKAQGLPVGNPSSGRVALGPLITQQQRDRAFAIVHDSIKAGAKLLTGGKFDALFFEPTVLSGVRPGMRAFEEEIFAPVVSITEFDTDDEAVELANQTTYGLAAAVISRSVDRALALGNRLNTGLLHINDQTVNDDVVNPFGGRGQSGNGTNIGGPANWEEFSQWQWVTIKPKATAYPF